MNELNDLLTEIQSVGENFPPELQKVARFVLENTDLVVYSSIRELATMARVKHSTMVRFAKANGFSTYSEFRSVFRPKRYSGNGVSLSLSSSPENRMMQGQNSSNLEVFNTPEMNQMIKDATKIMMRAKTCFVLGVGVANAVARNFSYLARMIAPKFVSLPSGGDLPIDVLGRGTNKDVLVAMTFKPFRHEVIEAVKFAESIGIPMIAISDSPACPIMARAEIKFVIPSESPHFFPSMVPTTALFEIILGYLMTEIGDEELLNLRQFHNRRHSFGIYVEAADEPE